MNEEQSKALWAALSTLPLADRRVRWRIWNDDRSLTIEVRSTGFAAGYSWTYWVLSEFVDPCTMVVQQARSMYVDLLRRAGY